MAATSRRAGGPEPAVAGPNGVYCPGCGLPLADTSLIVHEGCPADPRQWVSVPPPSLVACSAPTGRTEFVIRRSEC
jgi:hypothetical protein